MIRGTQQQQIRLSARRRKTSSARRAVSSTNAPRGAEVRRRVTSGKASPVVVQSAQDVEREAALKDFGIAIRYFRRRDYQRASELFARVATGPVVADSLSERVLCARSLAAQSSVSDRPDTSVSSRRNDVAGNPACPFPQRLQSFGRAAATLSHVGHRGAGAVWPGGVGGAACASVSETAMSSTSKISSALDGIGERPASPYAS